jgi:hypothetical protein
MIHIKILLNVLSYVMAYDIPPLLDYREYYLVNHKNEYISSELLYNITNIK